MKDILKRRIFISFVWFVAISLSIFRSFPQIIKIIQTRSAVGVSIFSIFLENIYVLAYLLLYIYDIKSKKFIKIASAILIVAFFKLLCALYFNYIY